jgi:hypothetical protein
VTVVGSGVSEDVKKLAAACGLARDSVRLGWTDLGRMAVRRGLTGKVGLGPLARLLVGGPSWKSRSVTCSNWDSYPLSDAQVRYAAMDAWASLAVFRALSDMDEEIAGDVYAAGWELAPREPRSTGGAGDAVKPLVPREPQRGSACLSGSEDDGSDNGGTSGSGGEGQDAAALPSGPGKTVAGGSESGGDSGGSSADADTWARVARSLFALSSRSAVTISAAAGHASASAGPVTSASLPAGQSQGASAPASLSGWADAHRRLHYLYRWDPVMLPPPPVAAARHTDCTADPSMAAGSPAPAADGVAAAAAGSEAQPRSGASAYAGAPRRPHTSSRHSSSGGAGMVMLPCGSVLLPYADAHAALVAAAATTAGAAGSSQTALAAVAAPRHHRDGYSRHGSVGRPVNVGAVAAECGFALALRHQEGGVPAGLPTWVRPPRLLAPKGQAAAVTGGDEPLQSSVATTAAAGQPAAAATAVAAPLAPRLLGDLQLYLAQMTAADAI